MFTDRPSQTFRQRLRQSSLEADWRRIVERLTDEERREIPDNPLFAIDAVAGDFGCELSSVGLEDSVDIRFIKRYGENKQIISMVIGRELLADPPGLEALLRAALPRQVAAANDKNTIRELFGPAASR